MLSLDRLSASRHVCIPAPDDRMPVAGFFCVRVTIRVKAPLHSCSRLIPKSCYALQHMCSLEDKSLASLPEIFRAVLKKLAAQLSWVI